MKASRREHFAGGYAEGHRIGPYELRERLGWGGMGIVFRARQASASRDVALKIISPSLAANSAAVKRFEQEIRAAARLQHPHILPVYDAGVDGRNPYLVLAYVTGGSLAERIAARPGSLRVDDVVHVVGQVASALDYAHTMGVIHRDVKPGNILLDEQGNVYLSDFGVARLVEEVEPEPIRPPGTDAYMAPEVAAGRDAVPASDIFGLGVLTFEMLTGRTPSTGDQAALARQRGNPLDLRRWRADVPRGVAVLVEQALHPDPAARPQSALALARALYHASRAVAPEGEFWAAPPAIRARGPTASLPTPPPDQPGSERPALPDSPSLDASQPRNRGDRRSWLIALALGVPLFILLVLLAISLNQIAGF